MKKKGRFDYILLETTGLADPGMNIFPLTEGCILILQHLVFILQDQLLHFFGLTVNSVVIFI
jgi:hypothetical protein